MDNKPTKIINHIVKVLKSDKSSDIKAVNSSLKSPDKLFSPKRKNEFRPDVSALIGDSTYLFSVESDWMLSISDEDKERWKLFSLYAKLNEGYFYLIAKKSTINSIESQWENVPSHLKFLDIKSLYRKKSFTEA